MASLDQLAMAKRCSHEGVVAGAKAAVVATIATAIPTMASVRVLPWARAHLNPTAQALIISTAAGMAYFIVADKTILATARRNSFGNRENGIDYLSIGIGVQDEVIGVHLTLLNMKDIIPVEGLNLDDVVPGIYTVKCHPLRFPGFDGSPARCILQCWPVGIFD
ncbi:unnamed protein product [Cuscuta campestris]|uniref:Early nodulin-93 n=1 Tax=Cuscuta campestris TaxID=132261 RepID=A0A484NNF0_9ASTE|nr:unnamed protein product [Cuscuta campestris]